jgi:Tfp pilus assembly protein PilV
MTLTRAMHRRARELRARGAASESGFSIVEVMIAIFLLLVGILGALLMVNTANSATFANNARTSGVNLAREVADGSRSVTGTVPYSQLSNGCPSPSSPANPCSSTSPMVTTLQGMPGLAPDSASPADTWNIKRGGITYTVKVSVCSMDDPSDGYGSRAMGGPYCSDVAAGGTSDPDGDDYKRVVVDVRWSGTRDSGNARAVSLISAGGVNGPSVTCLRPTGSSCPATPQITSAANAAASQSFTATLNATATRLDWYVDGTYAGTTTPSGTTATFTWNLGFMNSSTRVQDGSYEISATAFNANGVSGSTGSVQVLVNRQIPSMPGGYTVGRDTRITGNGSIGGVDLDWLPANDRDVLYYRIYRQAGTATPG